jgi:regulatory protein
MTDRVTAIMEDRGGYRVTVNDGEPFRLSRADFRAFPLNEGQKIDLAQLMRELLLRQYPEALNRAVGLLAIRPRSHREVERRLTEKGYHPDTIEMVLYKLEKESLVDDETFAHEWAAARSQLHIGRARILQELRQKGVAQATAQAAIDELDADSEYTAAVALAAKLLKRHEKEPSPVALRKSIAAMQRRGYAYGEASRALRSAIDNSDED